MLLSTSLAHREAVYKRAGVHTISHCETRYLRMGESLLLTPDLPTSRRFMRGAPPTAGGSLERQGLSPYMEIRVETKFGGARLDL